MKLLCTNISCSGSVYGDGGGNDCPGCGQRGRGLNGDQVDLFLAWYSEASRGRTS